MRPDFIFMLTRNDRTVPDALAHLSDTVAAGVRHIGFKDVGLPLPRLKELARAIRSVGSTVYLEVVSLDAASETASARAALELEVDVLMGGTRPEVVLPIIAGSDIRYYPFPGQIEGHPSRLRGPVQRIVESATNLLSLPGVDGLDLLAYRFDGDAADLMQKICRAAGKKPVIIAGSIDRPERIASVVTAGAAGFTIGTAALDGVLPASPRLKDQLDFVRDSLEFAISSLYAPPFPA